MNPAVFRFRVSARPRPVTVLPREGCVCGAPCKTTCPACELSYCRNCERYTGKPTCGCNDKK